MESKQKVCMIVTLIVSSSLVLDRFLLLLLLSWQCIASMYLFTEATISTLGKAKSPFLE